VRKGDTRLIAHLITLGRSLARLVAPALWGCNNFPAVLASWRRQGGARSH